MLFVVNCFAQSPKQVLYSFYDWKYPKVKIESNKIGVIIEDPTERSVIDNQVSAYAIRNLSLRNLEIVAPTQSDYLLFIHPISTYLDTKTEKITNGNDISYIGQIIFTSKLNFTIKRKNEVVYTKDFNSSQVVSEVRTYNNFSIKTEEIANNQIQLLLKNSSGTINQNCYDLYNKDVLYNFFKEIKETIDFTRIEETLPLYKFKDDDLDQINQSVNSFEFTRNLEDTDENYLKIKNLLAEKIKFWESEVSKYDVNDKKTKKIYWALMANISTSYYALGDNAKAIEFKDKALLVDYNKNYRYLAEMPEKKIKNMAFLLNAEGKPFIDFEKNDFSKKQNFDAVYFTNKKGKLLINSDISEQAMAIKQNRVEVIYQILACSRFYDFLLSIVNDYNEKEADKSIFFKNTDDYFFNLTKHYNDLSKELLVADLKNFNMEEKNTILKVSNKIYDLTDVLYKRLEQSQKVNQKSRYSEFFKTLVKLDDLLAHYPGTSKKLDEQALTKMVFISQDQTILDLPYLGMLADELTTEGHSQYKEHPKIYQSLFKQYKKNFNNLMGSTILKNLHEKETIKFDEIINSFYMPLSREKIENINVKFKNQYNNQSILRILMLFSK